MALLHTIKSGQITTFGHLEETLFQRISSHFGKNGCNRVDVVFDRYDQVHSIKTGEHEKRQSLTSSYGSLEVKIHGTGTPVPKQWQRYLSNSKNKSILSAFLCDIWCKVGPKRLHADHKLVLGGGFKVRHQTLLIQQHGTKTIEALCGDHEKADTRIILHAQDASKDHSRVVVKS